MRNNWKTTLSLLFLCFAGTIPAGEAFLKGTPDS